MSAEELSNSNSNGPVIGGVLAAIGASVCCVGPFLLLSLGISGAWIANLTLLEPYRWVFILAVLGMFAWAGWKIYRPVETCEPDSACAVPQNRKRRQLIFWISAVIAFVLVSSSYWIPWIA